MRVHDELERDAVIAAAPPEAAAALRTDASLWSALVSGWREAAAAWRGTPVSPSAFASYLGARLPDSGDPTAIAKLAVADLLLACACVNGHAWAQATLRERHLADVHRGIGRQVDSSRVDELVQHVFRHLLVREDDRAPRLEGYRGRGPLGRWLSVVARRVALDHARRRDDGTVPLGDDGGVAAAYGDPELATIRSDARDAFRSALEAAAAALRPRERNMLRYAFVHQLHLSEIAGIYRISESTARRQLAAVREQLVAAVRERVRERLRLDSDQLDRELGDMKSALAVSLSRLLRA
jgi:RNA polymerase sigma-70 factor